MNINFLGRFIDNIMSGARGGASLPVLIGIILSVAFIAMLLVTIFTLISLKRAELKAKKIIDLPPSALQDGAESRIKEEGVRVDQNATVPRHFGEWLNKILINKGYISVNSIVKSFFKTMNFLKDSLGSGYKYKLPWFMILGTEDSGKSSLLSGFTHDEIFDDEEEDATVTWWFLKNGVVLDVKGNAFLPKDSFNADERSWNIILNMLSRYRSKRPINGLILTIPADELYGKNKKPIEEIKKRAQFMARKLNFAQNYLGMKLPIYITVTKTDVVPGFQSFCSEIPVRNRTNMLGWSSPYPIDTIYHPKIIDDAFDSLEDELNELRMEIFSESAVTNTIDGIFVFSSELLTMRESLGCYIDTLFKTSSVEERFYLRGFYFTGDSKMVPLLSFDNSSKSQNAMAIMGTPDADVNEAGSTTVSFRSEEFIPKKIFFFEDLLLRKVFMEEGIASPMKSKVQQYNKSIFLAKISTAAFVVIGSYGLFNAKDHLKKNRDNLYPSLFKISSLIKNASDLTLKNIEDNGNEILAECTNQLLSMMQQLNNARFSSLFVPASWCSQINNELTDTLRASYQRVVVRTIYMNLLLKAKYFLNLKPVHESTNIADVLNPHKSREYNLLKGYVEGLIELEKNIKKFDSLRTSADPKDLNDLIDYTFKGSLPKEFLDNYEQFRSILMNTPFSRIDLSPYKKTAYDVLMILFQNFLDTIFTSRSDNSIMSYLNNFINQLVKQNIKEIPDCKSVIKFSKDLTAVCKELGEEGKTWLDKDVFESDKEYESFLDGVETLFGREVAQQILDITAINFGYLKARLEEFNHFLKSDISKTHIKKPAKIKEKEAHSSGIYLMERCLKSLCSEPYMEVPGDYHLVTEIPEGKMIFWDDELVQYACETAKSFEQFFSTTIKDFPKSMQEGITLLAKSNLCAVIASNIAKAQSLVDSPSAISAELTSEELLQKQISELKGVAPKFASLLNVLRDDSVSFIFGDLRAILNRICFSLLGHVDKLLENSKPYYPNNLTFDYWQGEVGSGLLAYSAADAEELSLYIQLQRKLIMRLAKDFAEPIVMFLNSPSIYDQNYGNQGQLTKWTRIVDTIKALEKKDPSNSLSVLERFIKRTLNDYNLDNITSKITAKDLKSESGNYFVNIIKDIKKGIMARAEVLIRKRNIQRYNALRDYYTKHLDKTYPFNNYDKSQRVANDADLDAVREMFKMYDEFGGKPEIILDQIYQLGDDGANKCYEFLKKIHSMREFFADFFENKYETMKVRLEIDFGINKREETNVDYLVDRIFKPNNEAKIESITSDKSATWYFGEPLEIDFRWAKGDDSAPQPVYDQNDPDLILDNETARIQCIGNWSILRFLQKYKAEGANTDQAAANQSILCFKIPLNNGKVSKIYAGVTASIPKRPGEASVTSVKVPSVPGKMPEIPRSVLALTNESVLVSKASVSAYEDSTHEDTDDTLVEEVESTKEQEKKETTNKEIKEVHKKGLDKKLPKKNKEKDMIKLEHKDQKMTEKVNDILTSNETPIIKEEESIIEVKPEPIE